MADHRIVVGVDGSDGGRRALAWAVHEAVTRGAVVQAVASWRWDDPYANSDPEQTRERAERTLRDGIAALGSRSAVTIAAEVVEGEAGGCAVPSRGRCRPAGAG
jgi:nucleotide-binding universal stress UspA family protein